MADAIAECNFSRKKHATSGKKLALAGKASGRKASDSGDDYRNLMALKGMS
jgi:hypothetical protein